MRIIGLTGGISTGKTTVSHYLATTYYLPILDADIYARDAVQLGSPVLKAIADRYSSMLLPDGNLNRQHLGNIVFSNPTERHWLEQQIHPYVLDRLQSELNTLTQSHHSNVIKTPLNSSSDLHAPCPAVVLVVPLLFEADMTDLVTEVWVVYCSEQQQIERLMQRDRLTLEQAQARINSQLPIQEKCDRANVILDNSSTQNALLKQVDTAIKSSES